MEELLIGKTLFFIFLLHVTEVVCSGVHPLMPITRMVHQNVTFNWTATVGFTISQAKWGLYSRLGDSVAPYFITVTKNTKTESPDLEKVASSYKNRVHFIGNISQGRAWFTITDLKVNDTNVYAVRITEASPPFNDNKFKVNLTVLEPVTPAPDTTTPPSESTTKTPVTDPSTPEQGKNIDVEFTFLDSEKLNDHAKVQTDLFEKLKSIFEDLLKLIIKSISGGSVVVKTELIFSKPKQPNEVENALKNALVNGTKLMDGYVLKDASSIKVEIAQPAEPPTTKKPVLTDGEIAGIVIGVLAFITIIVVVVVCVVKKKKDGRGKFHGIQMG